MGALSDPAVGRIVDEHYIATFEQVGTFKVTTNKNQHRFRGFLTKQGGNIVTYFCTPEQEVLSFTVGNVGAAAWAAEAKWSKELYDQTAGMSKAVQMQIVRDAHLTRVLDPSALFNGNDAPPTVQSLLKRDQLAKEFYQQLHAESEPADWRGEPVDNITWALRQVAASQRKKVHLLLAGMPLVSLAEVEEPVFRVLAGQPFGRRTFNNDLYLAAVRQHLAQQRPTLIFLTDQNGTHGSFRSPTLEELLTETNLGEFRPECNFLEMTQRDLQTLSDDLGYSPPPSYHGRRFTYVLFDKEGKPHWRAQGTTADQLVSLVHHAMARKVIINDADDEAARRKFVLAVNLVDHNREAAVRRFHEIVDTYPKTKTADQAQSMIAQLR